MAFPIVLFAVRPFPAMDPAPDAIQIYDARRSAGVPIIIDNGVICSFECMASYIIDTGVMCSFVCMASYNH